MTFPHASRTLAVLLTSATLWVGCKSSTNDSNNPTGPVTQMQWKQGTVTGFQKTTIDTLPGEPVVANSMTTYTSTLGAANVPLYGRDTVAVDVNVYSGATLTPTDSSIYSQDGGNDLYQWNFGLSQGLVLFNTTLKAFGINLQNPGWALEIKMASGKGIQWIAFEHDTTQTVTIPNSPLPVGIQVKEQDQAQMMGDTTFFFNATSYKVKHAQHSLSFTASLAGSPLLSWNESVDVFVSADLASPVLTVIHPSTVNVGAALKALAPGVGNRKAQGSQSVLVSHQ